jgi:hypothetical protein
MAAEEYGHGKTRNGTENGEVGWGGCMPEHMEEDVEGDCGEAEWECNQLARPVRSIRILTLRCL